MMSFVKLTSFMGLLISDVCSVFEVCLAVPVSELFACAYLVHHRSTAGRVEMRHHLHHSAWYHCWAYSEDISLVTMLPCECNSDRTKPQLHLKQEVLACWSECATMDLVLNVADHYVLTPYVYPASWPEDGALRQILSLLVVTNLGAAILYLGLGAISYFFIFDHDLMKHPHFLENQVLREIKYAMTSLPWISVPTVALFFAEVRGYSKLYDNVGDSPLGWPGLFLSMISFLLFTDMCIYWIHRFLHHKLIYKLFHKPHHIWKIPTPFASHAFHPVDGFLQGLPYHIYPFLFPLHKVLYLLLYVFVNIWTISIHDGDYRVPDTLTSVINGSAHHTDHHLFFDYNYGQYFTLWDRLGGSYRHPSALMGKGPLEVVRKLQAEGKLSGRGKTKEHANGHSQNGRKDE